MDPKAVPTLEQSADNNQPSLDSSNSDELSQLSFELSRLSLEQRIALKQALLDLEIKPRRHSHTTFLGQLSSALKSFSLSPRVSVRGLLSEAGVHATAEEALAADWRRVGRDMWSGLLAELNQRRSAST